MDTETQTFVAVFYTFKPNIYIYINSGHNSIKCKISALTTTNYKRFRLNNKNKF